MVPQVQATVAKPWVSELQGAGAKRRADSTSEDGRDQRARLVSLWARLLLRTVTRRLGGGGGAGQHTTTGGLNCHTQSVGLPTFYLFHNEFLSVFK